MCGFAGVFDREQRSDHDQLSVLATSMSHVLRHRGPDDEGAWVDAARGVGLGHCRLSIIDLSPAGRQPMHSPSRRYVLVYNGEIYNYRELRRELESRGIVFAGDSDTEVLTGGLDVWGIDGVLERLDGMFAFAVWDQSKDELLLARDRFGEKPLYWGTVNGRLLFGSELRALAEVTPDLDLDVAAVADVLAHKCVRGERSIFRQFRRLLPGHVLVAGRDERPRVRPYWSAVETAVAAMRDPLDITEDEAVAELGERLEAVVASRMVADVPIGTFLSGGVDSAGIAAFMVRAATGPVRTFTVGLGDPRFDESAAAQVVADRLGTEHHQLRVTESDVLDLVPKLPAVYDEPFADSSQLPTLLVSRFAVGEVKVALTGDGGDEVFAGYNRHVHGDGILRVHAATPATARRWLGRLAASLDPARAEAWFERLSPFVPAKYRVRLPADKLRKLGRVLQAEQRADIYEALVTDMPRGALLGRRDLSPYPGESVWREAPQLGFGETAALADTVSYLPDDILVKVDRAAMAVSLETRAPYLSHSLFEWSWRLPWPLKVADGIGKRVLRGAVARELGSVSLPQVKSGFGVPVGSWLRGPLRSWAEDLLFEEATAGGQLLARGPIDTLWREHLREEADHTDVLWSVLMLRSWLESNGFGRLPLFA